MVKPSGLMFAATLNRTLKSFALAIVGAEYVLRWVPRGTHQWDKFVTPEELERASRMPGCDVIGERGVIYNPLADRWQLSSDMDVNYMLVAARKDRAELACSGYLFTLIAAAAQTARNAMQRELTATLGTVGATHVRFLFGFPFARAVPGRRADGAPARHCRSRRSIYWPWITLGCVAQIVATAMMLSAMSEPLLRRHHRLYQDRAGADRAVRPDLARRPAHAAARVAILIATAGVVMMSFKPGVAQAGGYKPT